MHEALPASLFNRVVQISLPGTVSGIVQPAGRLRSLCKRNLVWHFTDKLLKIEKLRLQWELSYWTCIFNVNLQRHAPVGVSVTWTNNVSVCSCLRRDVNLQSHASACVSVT